MTKESAGAVRPRKSSTIGSRALRWASAAVTSRRPASAPPPARSGGRPLRLLVIARLSPVCSVVPGPLFLHHAYLDLGAHVGMELDPDPELAQLPDRLREVHPALGDADPELLELALHVARGHGTVQLVLLTHLHREAEADLRDAGGLGFGGALLRGALLRDALRLVGDLLLVGVGRRVGKALRQQVVARVAVLDLDHVAGGAKMLHVFSQDDFHGPSFLSMVVTGRRERRARDDGVAAPCQRQPDQALDHEPERPRREQAHGGLERGVETRRDLHHVPHGPARLPRPPPPYFPPKPRPRPGPNHP